MREREKPTGAPRVLSPLQASMAYLRPLYDDHIARRKARRKDEKRAKDAARARDARANKRVAKELAAASIDSQILVAKNLRLRLLVSAVENPRGDKRIEQLFGRESEIATFWQARQLAIHRFGGATSDAVIAETYRQLTRDVSFNRNKARGRRLIVRFLEAKGGLWDPVLLPPVTEKAA